MVKEGRKRTGKDRWITIKQSKEDEGASREGIRAEQEGRKGKGLERKGKDWKGKETRDRRERNSGGKEGRVNTK